VAPCPAYRQYIIDANQLARNQSNARKVDMDIQRQFLERSVTQLLRQINPKEAERFVGIGTSGEKRGNTTFFYDQEILTEQKCAYLCELFSTRSDFFSYLQRKEENAGYSFIAGKKDKERSRENILPDRDVLSFIASLISENTRVRDKLRDSVLNKSYDEIGIGEDIASLFSTQT